MSTTTLSSRELNQQVSRAKRAAKRGPVIITDRGKPAHVLLSFEDYQKLSGKGRKIADLLAMPGVERVKFKAARLRGLPRPAEFS